MEEIKKEKMKKKKQNKTKYKRVIKWKKKPKWEELSGGVVFCLGAIFVLAILFDKDSSTTLLAFVMALLLIKGYGLFMKGLGNGRKKHYSKIK